MTIGRLKFDIDTLVKEMLDQIPQDILIHGTVLDPAFGGAQFLREVERRKRAAGKTDAEIAATVFGIEENQVRRNFAVNKYKLVGYYGVGNFLNCDFKNMKFDVIVGNPPYQSMKENSDQLWPLFTDKAISLTKDDGYTSLIIPDTWTSGTRSVTLSGRKNLLTEVFTSLMVLEINLDVKKYFPGIGSGFSYFIAKKSKPCGVTNITTDTERFAVDLRGLSYIPKTGINVISLGIIKKVARLAGEKVYFKFHGKTDGVELIGDMDSKHPYRYSNTSSNHPEMWGDKPGQGYGTKKVLYAYMGSKQKFEYDLTGDDSVMHNGRAFSVPDNSSEEGLRSYLESSLVRLLNKDKWSQYNEPKILNLLPVVDFSRVWTDAEIYKHFGLTQEEIEYVEANCK